MKKIILVSLLLLSIVEIQAQSYSQKIYDEIFNDIIHSFPIPVEIGFLLKDLNYSYDKTLLADMNHNTSEFQNVWNIGVYSANVGYSSIYEQKEDALKYLEGINTKMQDLRLSEIFNFELMKARNQKSSLDSLLMIATDNLEKVDSHFREKDKGYFTSVLLSGAWVEYMYIACKFAQKENNRLLNNRIAYQDVILDQLLLLFAFPKKATNKTQKLIKALKKIRKIYKKKPENDLGYVDANTFMEENLDKITETLTQLRNKMLE